MKAKKGVLLATVATGVTMTLAGLLSSESIADDERVVFYTTSARLDGEAWIVPIHGNAHELESAGIRRRLIAAILRSKYDLEATTETQANFDRRARFFCADNERGKRVRVRLGSKTYTLPESKSNGHFRAELRLPKQAVEAAAVDGKLTVTAVLPSGDEREFTGTVLMNPPSGVSVVSDIDDTVKVTHVTDRKRMLHSTFFGDFEAAPGMSALYRSWAEKGARFHYVSSSPWQLYEPLNEFLGAAGFPDATYSLKFVRLKDPKTIVDLASKSGLETKPPQIEAILRAYPERKFVLVGDSGEQDPEVYAGIARAHPGRILAIYIRNVTGARADDARFRDLFGDLPGVRWRLFEKPSGLELPGS